MLVQRGLYNVMLECMVVTTMTTGSKNAVSKELRT